MATLSQADLLKRVPLFQSLSAEQAVALADATTKKRFKRHELIVEHGKKSGALYIILSGHARVTLASAKGREIVLASLSSGDCIGEMSLMDDQPHSATVTADSTLDALVLAQATFNSCLVQNGHLAVAIMRGLVGRLRKANQKIADLALVSVYGRVARHLIDTAQPLSDDEDTSVVPKFSNISLAKEIGASREMVSKALKDFERQGFVRKLEDGSLLLLNSPAMPLN